MFAVFAIFFSHSTQRKNIFVYAPSLFSLTKFSARLFSANAKRKDIGERTTAKKTTITTFNMYAVFSPLMYGQSSDDTLRGQKESQQEKERNISYVNRIAFALFEKLEGIG